MPPFCCFRSGELVDFEEAVLRESGHLHNHIEEDACGYLGLFAGVFDSLSPVMEMEGLVTEVYEVADIHGHIS